MNRFFRTAGFCRAGILVLTLAITGFAQLGERTGTFPTAQASDSLYGSRDSLKSAPVKPQTTLATEKIPVVKRRIDYKEQIFLALGMMLFIAFAMTSTQAWNPR